MDSFSLPEELLIFDINLLKDIFDVESLSKNINLQESIDLSADLLF